MSVFSQTLYAVSMGVLSVCVFAIVVAVIGRLTDRTSDDERQQF